MDPLTIISAVAAAAQLAATTANIGLQLYRFYCDLKNAPEKSKELCHEISDLSSVMQDFVQTLKAIEDSAIIIDVGFDDLLRNCSQFCQFLMDLSSLIQLNKNELKKRMKWPLSTKENEELIAKVERYKATFMLALESANLKLGSAHSYLSDNALTTIDQSLEKSTKESPKSLSI